MRVAYMMIREVNNINEKRDIATCILNNLPEWFGLTKETAKYIEASTTSPFIAYFVDGKPVAFVVLKATSQDCAEIFVMGVLKEYHRTGIGKKLYVYFEDYARKSGFSYLQVKTIPKGHYREYDKTNLFYHSVGFCEMECFPTLWEEHPCQIYIKKICI